MANIETTILIPQQIYEDMYFICRENGMEVDRFIATAIKDRIELERKEKDASRMDGGTESMDVIFRRAQLCKCGGAPQYFVNHYENTIRVNCSRCQKEKYSEGTTVESLKNAVELWNKEN